MKHNLRKALAATFLAVTLLIGNFFSNNVQLTYAAMESETKTAKLNNAKISFNGAEPRTVQAYNIDGYNYIRARDITDAVDMEVNPVLNGEHGIMITSDSPAQQGAPMEPLNVETISVTLAKGKISYRGVPFYTECFNYDGRYYFKLADIAAAAEQSLQLSLELLEIQAKGDVAKGPMIDRFSSVSVQWDNNAGIINVNRVEHDFVKAFNEIRGVADPAAREIVHNAVTTPKAGDVQVVAQPPLASAPKVGTRLANILIDESLDPYKESGNINRENLQPIYNKPVSIGQCTWYASCRFEETTGIDIVTAKAPNNLYGSDLIDWVNAAKENCPNITGISDKNAITAQAIAVWDGHITFVEFVEYDDDGKPTTVYYTEANSGHDGISRLKGVYYPDFDCIVKKSSFEEFLKKSTGDLLGYIVAE
jgi:hypothetical protein